MTTPAGGLDRFAIARALREVARLMGVKGENPFRARAYERGAQALERLNGDLDTLLREGRLTDTPGIGPALAAEIATLHGTGRSPRLERLRGELPPGVLDLVRVPGLGVGRVAALHEALGIGSLEDLRAACEAGRVRAVKGFGPATERRLLDAVRALGSAHPRLALHRALEEAEPLLAHLRGAPGVARVEIAGSLRRGAETVGDIDLVAGAHEPGPVLDALEQWPRVTGVLERGGRLAIVEIAAGARAELHVVEPGEFFRAWHRLTGSTAHVARVEAIAPQGRARAGGEADVYASRGLPWIAPELREDAGEVEAAAEGTLPSDLVTLADLRGFVHCHTTWSDGRASLEEMARAAEALGAEYLTVTDHSPAAFYARGLDLPRLREQWQEIERVQERVSVRLLRGTEADILADGALDWPDEVLEQLDVVVASVHSRHGLDARRTTRRLVRALRHPLFKIWGHALGRLLQRRPPLECDVPAVLDAAAESRVAIEVNGDPHRLDMEPRWIREARKRGLRFVISTDAHSPGELGNARYGVLMARRGWLRKADVLNTLPFESFQAAVRPTGGGA